MISRDIHYVWLSDDDKPTLINKCIESWERQLPGYKLREWKMGDFDFDTLPEFVKEAIERKKYAFATDYLRMKILYENGGIYLDSDVLVLNTLDEFLDNGFFSCIEYHHDGFMQYKDRINEKGEALTDKHIPGFCIQAAFLGAEKGHPFVKDCMDYYEHRHFVKEDGSNSMDILAPDIYALCARDHGFLYKNELQSFGDRIKIYPSYYVAGSFYECDNRNYAVHCCAGSWREPYVQSFRNKLRRALKKLIFPMDNRRGKQTENVGVVPSEQTVAFCILARDCEMALLNNLMRLEALRRAFRDTVVFIIENNSRDNTRAVIRSFAATHEGIIPELFDDPHLDELSRMERMAVLRNRYLDMIKSSDFKPDLMIVIDGDTDSDLEAIEGVIKKAPSGWHALFANGRYYLMISGKKIPIFYYDLFALVPFESRKYKFNEMQVQSNGVSLEMQFKKHAFVKCDSAFGGVGIYRYEYIPTEGYTLEAYDGTDETGYICEHIPFNRSVKGNGANYICRDLMIKYEEKPLRECLGLIKYKIICYLKDNSHKNN